MTITADQLKTLRRVIQENLRIQRGGSKTVAYIDVANVRDDMCARQNHTVFARRGCGKTLLLHDSATHLDETIKTTYLNCEDFKKHSFPNVLIEILDALFKELEQHLTGWFGRKPRSKQLIQQIRSELAALRTAADSQDEDVRKYSAVDGKLANAASIGAKLPGLSGKAGTTSEQQTREETERSFKIHSDKIKNLDMLLPRIKELVREFFEVSSGTKAVFLQIDDLYHLRRPDQPFVADYIHRLCKDLPLYFKIATLRHASTLFIDRGGQPIGAQERHDYQPINIDYTFGDFKRTRDQNWQILLAFAKLAGIDPNEVDSLFKGQGFDRLVMAGGGVPRDVLSLFLEVLSTVQAEGDGRIGKDDVRVLSRSNFERRIEELKQDSEGGEQDVLMRGIYVLREFCLTKETNVFVISERLLQQRDDLRSLVNRLLDYRIIHNVGTALTHKSEKGTFQAFAIDIGCYAHLRKLYGRFNELDLSDNDVKEKIRSTPVLGEADWTKIWDAAPPDVQGALLSE
jgi:hypothetical protein